MSLLDKMTDAFPVIATQSELEQRRAQRAAPTSECNLTPDSWEIHALKTRSAQANEQRIVFLERRLQRAHNRIETDHTFARLNGKARADFGRCSE